MAVCAMLRTMRSASRRLLWSQVLLLVVSAYAVAVLDWLWVRGPHLHAARKLG